MNTSELDSTKKELVGWIESLKDDSVIGLLNLVKLSSENISKDWWSELTKSDKDNILIGIRDYQQGNVLNSKDFWNGIANE